MSALDAALQSRITTLKQELKTWERAFAAANDGRKAGREDIKKDTAIGRAIWNERDEESADFLNVVAAKYKEYDGLRRPQPKKPHTDTSTNKDERKEVEVDKRNEVDQKNQADKRKEVDVGKRKEASSRVPAATPQKKRQADFIVHPAPQVHSIAVHEEVHDPEPEPTPAAIRMQLGPTPQKDGHVLSLFDSLPSVTPSKSRTTLFDIQGNVVATPSKRHTTIAQSPAIDNPRGSRTPASSGKRFMLDTFATPLKRKRDDDEHGHGTPSSSMKLLATPAFLRRSHTVSIMESLAEEARHDDEVLGLTRPRGPPFKKQRGFIRSLSSIIQGMRKQEDDALDEQMDIMNEMEAMDDFGSPGPDVVQETQPKETSSVNIVEDSQVVMPLGPDKGYESEESSDEDQPGNGKKPWKKKGLKRQTKRVIMRPVIHKPKKLEAQIQPQDSDVDSDPIVTADSQQHTKTTQSKDDKDNNEDESDYSDSSATKTSKPVPVATKDPDGPVKKATRMISAGAHANFRRLNIRNKNTKANGKGRFGKR